MAYNKHTDRQIRKSGFRDYDDYINSDYWRDFSNWIISTKKKCYCCSSVENL